MPQQKVITVYSFDELAKDVQAKVINKNREINFIGDDWCGSVYEDAKNVGLEINGFNLEYKTIKGYFINSAIDCAKQISSGIINMVMIAKVAKQPIEFIAEDKVINEFLTKYESEINENSDTINNIELQRIENLANSNESIFKNSLLSYYLKMLQDELDYLYSDFAIMETIKSNYFEFLKNGERIILPENTETKEIERESYTNC